jgi:DNA-directed RNA polymerase subunit RPC12/RpoP
MADNKKTSVIKCASCGADMLFSPDKGKLACPYCESTKDIEKSVAYPRDYIAERNDGEVIEGESTYKCPNCGGEVVMSDFQTATDCPFCGATNIVLKESLPGLKPDSVLPFLLSKEKALGFGKQWLKKKLFAPSKLKKSLKTENFKGVYIPSFAFDSDTNSAYSGVLGERRTRWVGTGKDRHAETYIHWYSVSGEIDRTYNDILIEASAQITQKELNKLLPYDTLSAEAYKREYLAGFSAERYNTPLDVSYGKAKDIMDADIKSAVLARYHADVVQSLNINTSYNNIKFNYSLLPLWIFAYKFKEKLYRFVVNGRNGKATGKIPLSPAKVSIALAVALGIIALLVWLFGFSGISF